MKRLAVALVVVVGLVAGALLWDVCQLRALRPPEDRSFEGFVRDGREGSLLVDRTRDRLYWTAPPRRTLVKYADHVYEFDRSGRLVNWTPGDNALKGMILDRPVVRGGTSATVDEARAWIRRK